jgi:hypothetical protein
MGWGEGVFRWCLSFEDYSLFIWERGGMVFFEIAQLNTGYRYLLIPITKSAGYKSDISYRIMEEVSNGLL